jgi:hypothetical protein
MKPSQQLPSIPSAFLFLILLPLISFSQSLQPFRVTWNKELSRGPVELSRIEMNEKGNGHFQYKRRDQEMIETEFVISSKAVKSIFLLFEQADFLNPSKEFVSPRKVADTGKKTLRYEQGDSNREVTFNFSEDKNLWKIVDFFENLCGQEQSFFELELALKYDKLGIPKRLEDLESDIKSNRIVSPERFCMLLNKIYTDTSLMNLARVEAHQLITLIEKKK